MYAEPDTPASPTGTFDHVILPQFSRLMVVSVATRTADLRGRSTASSTGDRLRSSANGRCRCSRSSREVLRHVFVGRVRVEGFAAAYCIRLPAGVTC